MNHSMNSTMNHSMNMSRNAPQSPAFMSSSFFIPNTPINHRERHRRHKEAEPGSAKVAMEVDGNERDILSQPEGVYSPIPIDRHTLNVPVPAPRALQREEIYSPAPTKSRMNMGHCERAQSPVPVPSPMMVDHREESPAVDHQMADRIRSEVMAELEKMDFETTRAVQQKYSRIEPSSSSSSLSSSVPSPSSLLSGMSKLQISRQRELELELKPSSESKPKLNVNPDGGERRGRGIEFVQWVWFGREVLSVILVALVVMLYLHIIDLQWKW